jgi:hypothetical protein
MWRAEIALEYSILKYAKSPVEITFIRSGDPGWRTNVDEGLTAQESKETRPDLWNVGRDHPTLYSPEGWATPFSCMRFTIPELCNFEGRAIHLDVDFLVLRDLRPMFDAEMTTPMMGPANCRTDCMLIDCAAFKDLEGWPSIEQMRPSGWHIERDYKEALHASGMMSESPQTWESWDGKDYIWHSPREQATDTSEGTAFEESKFFTVHYTNMHTQPWKPVPGMFEYPPHPHPVATYMFWEHYAEAMEKWQLGYWQPQTTIPEAIYDDVGAPLGEWVDVRKNYCRAEVRAG